MPVSTPFEFPAYNLFYKKSSWIIYGDGPIVQKTLVEMRELSEALFRSSEDIKEVRIYGIFNNKQTLVEEISRENFPQLDSKVDIARKGIKAAIAICDNALKRGMYDELSTSTDFEMIRKILLESL